MKTLACVGLVLGVGASAAAQGGAAVARHAAAAYGRLPLSFAENQGQADARVAFVAQGSGYAVVLQRGSAGFLLREGGLDARTAGVDLRMTLPGSAARPAVAGEDELPGKSNYLTGSDSSQWHTGVSNFARVRYAGAYPGVDVVYYGTPRQMEFDFVVASGADAGAIRLALEGTVGGRPAHLLLNGTGDVVTTGEGGRVVLHRPVIYQVAANGRKEMIDGAFVLTAGKDVRLQVGAYDHSRELVIDPKLVYADGPGGCGLSNLNDVALDAAGNAYVVGNTDGGCYVTTPEALPYAGPGAFVEKISPDGTARVYSTYFGNQTGQPNVIAIDAAGDAYVAGDGNPGTVPITPRAFLKQGSADASDFVFKLDPSGSKLLYSTYFYGRISAIAVDQADSAYVLGTAVAAGFPITPGVFQPLPGKQVTSSPATPSAGYLTKFSPDGSSLLYSTFVGGNTTVPGRLRLDASKNAYIFGGESQPGFYPATPGAYAASGSEFVLKLNAQVSKVDYRTYLGDLDASDFVLDPQNNLYFSGSIAASGPPTVSGAQKPCGQCENALVFKLNSSASALVYSAILGKSVAGDPDDPQDGTFTSGDAIAVDSAGRAFVSGVTVDPKYPTTPDAYQRELGTLTGVTGPSDTYLTELDPSGKKILYSTFLGNGNGYLAGEVLQVNAKDEVVLAGYNGQGSIDPTPANVVDPYSQFAFLAKFRFGELFCSFVPQLQVDASTTREQGFAAAAQFALPAGASVDLTSVPVSVTIAGQVFTVPAGKLLASNGMYSFSGVVNGGAFYLQVQKTGASAGGGCGTGYSLFASDRSTSFAGIANPVAVQLSVGDYAGTAEVQANIVH